MTTAGQKRNDSRNGQHLNSSTADKINNKGMKNTLTHDKIVAKNSDAVNIFQLKDTS